MLFNYLVVAGYGVLVFLCVFILLRVVLGRVEEGFSQVNERLDRMANSPKGDGGKAPNTGSNSTQKRDDKATATGKPYPPNRPHTDR